MNVERVLWHEKHLWEIQDLVELDAENDEEELILSHQGHMEEWLQFLGSFLL